MIYFLSALFGLVLGSFANVCIVRFPKDESIYFPPSRCPHCHTRLRKVDNVPLLSFLLLRGRCHSCHTHISWQYPLVEFSMMALFLVNAYSFHAFRMRMLIVDVASFYLLTISIIDFRHQIIPDELSLSFLAFGLCVAWKNPYLVNLGVKGLVESFTAGILGGSGMLALAWLGDKMFKKESLGGGDVKLVAAFGALFGGVGLFGSLMLGSLLGGIAGVLLIVSGKKSRKDAIPFGPFLSLGAYAICYLPFGWLRFIFP